VHAVELVSVFSSSGLALSLGDGLGVIFVEVLDIDSNVIVVGGEIADVILVVL
jgi:hypothetical protein